MSEVTRILEAMQKGKSKDTDESLPLAYTGLRRLAAAQMAREADWGDDRFATTHCT